LVWLVLYASVWRPPPFEVPTVLNENIGEIKRYGRLNGGA